MTEKELKFDSWHYVLFTGFNEMLDYEKQLEREKIKTEENLKSYSKWLDEQIHTNSDVRKKEAYTDSRKKFTELFK